MNTTPKTPLAAYLMAAKRDLDRLRDLAETLVRQAPADGARAPSPPATTRTTTGAHLGHRHHRVLDGRGVEFPLSTDGRVDPLTGEEELVLDVVDADEIDPDTGEVR